ncbi:MAG: hypothetical protein U0V49_02580 [Saprospiraceae bacterium]
MRYFPLSIILVLLYSCGDDGPNCPGDISLPVEISPFKPYYSIGDTVTISSKFYALIYDQKTEKFYNSINYRFTPIIYLNTIDSSDEYNWKSKVHELSTFIQQSNEGMNLIVSAEQGVITGEYNLAKDSLYLSVQLILKSAGLMSLRIGSLTSGDSHLQNNYHFGCRGREITFCLKSPAEDNIKLLQQHRSNERNNWILADSIGRFKQYAGYCFEVK